MQPLLVGFTVRALAQSAVRAGARPVAVDYFGDRDLMEACPQAVSLERAGLPFSPEALAEAAEGCAGDAVAYTGGLENHPQVVARLARRAPLLGNPPEVLAAVRDWRAVAAALALAGFRVPVTLPPGAAVPADGVWLEKPLAGAGGAGVALAEPGSVPPATRLVQERVAGWPGSALFVAGGRQARLLGVTEQLAARPEFGSRGFRYTGNILLPSVPPLLRKRLAEMCQFLTERYGLVGLNGVDFVAAGAEAVPIEVNPRWTAAMELLEWATGCSLFALHLEGCAGRCPPPLPAWTGYFGKAVVYGVAPGVWRFAGDWAAAGLRDVPQPGAPVAAGRPVCTVLAAGPDRDACLAALVARAAAIRRECVAPRVAADSWPVHETGDQRQQG